MSKTAFDKIAEGLTDALSFARGDTPDAADLARLKATAEDPLIAPSMRVEARTILKALAREQEQATNGELRRRIKGKIRDGIALSWRERIQAQELKLLAKRAEG